MIDLEKLKQAREAATPGPWDLFNGTHPKPIEVSGCLLAHFSGGPSAKAHQKANTEMIAMAPDLADAVIELTEALDAILRRSTPHPDDTCGDRERDLKKVNGTARAALAKHIKGGERSE